MREVDDTSLEHWDKPPYDPVKAHEYYMRHRKLKGKKRVKKLDEKGQKQLYNKALTKFLGKLPMAVEGASAKETAAFVDKMRKMSDKEMVAEAQKIRKEKGDMDGAQVATINALLQNRMRVRTKKGTSGPKINIPTKKYLPPTLERDNARKSSSTKAKPSSSPPKPAKSFAAPSRDNAPKPVKSFAETPEQRRRRLAMDRLRETAAKI